MRAGITREVRCGWEAVTVFGNRQARSRPRAAVHLTKRTRLAGKVPSLMRDIYGEKMKRLVSLAVLAALISIRPSKAEFPISALTDNNPPWFIAARYLGALMVQPEIERNGEPEKLTNIIVTNPKFKSRSLQYPGSFLISPTPVGKVIGPVEFAIYTGARDITGGLFHRDEYNRACKVFAYGHE